MILDMEARTITVTPSEYGTLAHHTMCAPADRGDIGVHLGLMAIGVTQEQWLKLISPPGQALRVVVDFTW